MGHLPNSGLSPIMVRVACEVSRTYFQLAGPKAQIDPEFVAERLTAIDDVRGDIETLLDRIADIRTWTYVAAHPRWLSNTSALRERTMAIEDRLSDALHERLVQRFVEPGEA